MEDFVRNLYKVPTTSVGALPLTNYFDIEGGYKESLKEWNFLFQEEFNFDEALVCKAKKKITIPFIGEMNGYGNPIYTNDRYLFPYLPPYVIRKTSAQVYTCNKKIILENKDYILQFEGVDNAYYLFINKKFVGFSNISHATKRFDITKFLINGNNEIRIVVLKFTPSSYLEDQDKIRLSGIFRAIYLLTREHDRVDNFKVVTDVVNNDGAVTLTCDKNVKAALSGFDFSEEKSGEKITFNIKNAKLWCSEEPNLYDLKIEYNGETIIQKVGIRKIEIVGNKLLVNSRLVKLKGVNRHSMTLLGYGETDEIIEKDFELFKRFNINAIRTSHYPADERFYKLADKYGIYIMSESDVETHGVTRQDTGYDTIKWGEVINSPDFYDQLVERELNNVIDNMNHPSVLMWSLGNESGWGEVVEKLCKEIRKYDDRPIHYEGSFNYEKWEGYHEEDYLSVYSRMYPTIEYCLNDVPKLTKPFVLCEYVHAMGTSMGELVDYMKPFWEYDNFFGAFVWEWTNHYIVRNGIECYGGDFQEEFNDGQFCCDGLINVDRTITPQLYELRECYAPCKYEKKVDAIYLTNRLDFISLNKFRFVISTLENGIEVSKEEKHFDVESKQTIKILPNLNVNEKFNSYLIKVYDGDVLISEQSIVYEPVKPLEFKSNNDVKFEVGKDGLLDSILVNGKPILKNMQICIARPYISNDMKNLEKYEYSRIKLAKFYETNREESSNTIKVTGYMGVMAYSPFYKVVITYKNAGEISIHAEKIMQFDSPFKFGLRFELPDNYGPISYLGLKGESYIDRHLGNPFGYWTTSVEDNYRNIVPQNANDHFDTKFVKLDKDNIFINSDKPFSFQYDCFVPEDYKKHRNEMPLTKKRYLSLDYKTLGVGTMACGPELQEKYRITEKVIDFTFYFK